GAVVISSNSADAFDFLGSGLNGINGVIGASAGLTGGQAGSISITNTGRGGITVNDPLADLLVFATEGSSGAITFEAPNGTVTIDSTINTALSANAAGSGDFQGGQITIAARTLNIIGGFAGALFLNAVGVNGGGGGTVSVTVTDPLADLDLGLNNGKFVV